jgi:plastocyanin
MLRLARKLLPLGLLMVIALPSAAQAATVNISVDNFMFTPKSATVQQGSTALWTNVNATTNHTTTSDTTMPISWDSGTLTPSATFQFTYTMAGGYSYHCTFHQSLGMVGTIGVPVKAAPSSGPAGTQFRITMATANPTGTLVFDVQKKDPGGVFQNWMLGVTTKSVVFNSTGQPTGTYQFRALLRDTASGKKSKFSPAASITVT